jgi:hypothetical protein
MDYTAFLEKRATAYAEFNGAISGTISDVSHTCMLINHNSSYKGMYNQLREEIQKELVKLTNKLDAIK